MFKWLKNLFSKKEVTSRDQLGGIRETLDGLLEVLTTTVEGLAELPAALGDVTEASNSRIAELTQQINEEKAVQTMVKVSTDKVTIVAQNINQLLGNNEENTDGNETEGSGEEVSPN